MCKFVFICPLKLAPEGPETLCGIYVPPVQELLLESIGTTLAVIRAL